MPATNIKTSCELGYSAIWKLDYDGKISYCGNYKNRMCLLINGFCPQQGIKIPQKSQDDLLKELTMGKNLNTNICAKTKDDILPRW